MSLSQVAAGLTAIPDLHLEVAVHRNPVDLATLLSKISYAKCTAGEFMRGANEIDSEAARILLTATLHRSMAYASEVFMPLDEARELAIKLITSAGAGARFYSTCIASDEVSGVSAWKITVTPNTFESVLYCVGSGESALLVAVAED